MVHLSPDARARLEAARRRDGRFGDQQHTPPQGGEPRLAPVTPIRPGVDRERFADPLSREDADRILRELGAADPPF